MREVGARRASSRHPFSASRAGSRTISASVRLRRARNAGSGTAVVEGATRVIVGAPANRYRRERWPIPLLPPLPPLPVPARSPACACLDLTRVLSGPHATRMLCDLGAEIIKVEPPSGDTTRFTTPRINGVSTYFAQQNVGKRNICLDMDKPEALELLLRLADQCDVLVENFRPGVADKLGLGYAAVSARNPKIVYASISGYGQTGPWVGRRAYAPVVQAESGYATMQALEHGVRPSNDSFSHADVYTGVECCAAHPRRAVPARAHRPRRADRRGDGADDAVRQRARPQRAVGRPRRPERDPQLRRRRVPGADRRQRRAGDHRRPPAGAGQLRRVHARHRPTRADRRPADGDDRLRREHLDEIEGILRDWAAKMPDAVAIEEALAPHKMATGRLRSVRELCSTDWAEAREVVVETSNRTGGTFKIPNTPWRFAGSDVRVAGNVRYRGEDNRDVLAELLGLDGDALAKLEANGVLSSRIPDQITP